MSTFKKIILIILVLVALNRYNCFAVSAETGKDYIIAPNDILDITVYGEEDLSTTARVAQDGTISYPLLGNIKVEGMTVRGLEGYIIKLLAEDYLVDPQVKVFVKQYANITVLGEVKVPGSYQMKEKFMLTEAIALTGGFTASANSTDIRIIRIAGDKKETLHVDFDRILEKALADVELKANDAIIVSSYGQFSFIGQVAKPGVYTLRKNLTIIDAISMAGGFTPIAAQNAAKIFREEGNKKITIKVPIADIMNSPDKSRNIEIKNGDIILVPESFF